MRVFGELRRGVAPEALSEFDVFRLEKSADGMEIDHVNTGARFSTKAS